MDVSLFIWPLGRKTFTVKRVYFAEKHSVKDTKNILKEIAKILTLKTKKHTIYELKIVNL